VSRSAGSGSLEREELRKRSESACRLPRQGLAGPRGPGGRRA
jgi:hypothetical protein